MNLTHFIVFRIFGAGGGTPTTGAGDMIVLNRRRSRL